MGLRWQEKFLYFWIGLGTVINIVFYTMYRDTGILFAIGINIALILLLYTKQYLLLLIASILVFSMNTILNIMNGVYRPPIFSFFYLVAAFLLYRETGK
ncbi:MAG: hypothetical protein J7K23_04160 [Thermoproteales archaeon]|nr:hypothetical protein [Thermoproteales archaeon]